MILGDVLSEQKSLNEALSTCCNLLRDGGYVLLFEPTNNLPLAWCLLDQQNTWNVDDERTCGRFCDEARWLEVFAEAGLEIVSCVADGLVHTAFLLKKQSSEVVKAEEIKWVEVVSGDYEWVEKLKAVVAEEGVRRVWLKGEQVHSGVVGLVTCLRREADGNKIRWAT